MSSETFYKPVADLFCNLHIRSFTWYRKGVSRWQLDHSQRTYKLGWVMNYCQMPLSELYMKDPHQPWSPGNLGQPLSVGRRSSMYIDFWLIFFSSGLQMTFSPPFVNNEYSCSNISITWSWPDNLKGPISQIYNTHAQYLLTYLTYIFIEFKFVTCKSCTISYQHACNNYLERN